MHSGLVIPDRSRQGPAPDCAAHRGWPWHVRLTSAVGRRLRAWRRRGGDRDVSFPIEATISRLERQAETGGFASRPEAPPCAGLTAALLSTLLEFGQLTLVKRSAEWLLYRQRLDGGFPQAGGDVVSLFNTAQALGAFIALNDARLIACAEPASRAAGYLATRLESELEHSYRRSDTCGRCRARSAIEVCCSAQLLAASRSLGVPRWRYTADRVASGARRAVDWHSWTSSVRLLLHATDAWLALGDVDLARHTLRWPTSAQRRNGAVPANGHGNWGENDVLAHLAVLWYKMGDRERGDRALAFLKKQQLPDGGWPVRCGSPAGGAASAWTARHYLEATRLQVASSFAVPDDNLPPTIDCSDERFTAVRDHLAALQPNACVADVGCGNGRFLRELTGRFPSMRLVGIDPSPAAIERLPPGVEPRRGSLLRIPAGVGEFDAAFAVESLEHSLLPERAISELCRVVRPGGRILIIDKHLAWQPLSLHAPWERWFLPTTVTGWLAPYCREVHVRPITHGGDSRANGLFLCWHAVRS